METKVQETTATTATERPSIDMLLELASAGMDARMDSEAADVVAAAIQEAESLAAEDHAAEEATFRSDPILKAAGDLIRVNGWHQGSYETTRDTALCAMQAVIWATDDRMARGEALESLLNRIARETGRRMSIPKWNDNCGDVSEVLRLLY